MLQVPEIRDWLGLTSTDHDAILEDLEERAVEFIEKQTDRYFGEVQSFTDIMDGSGFDVLWLPEAPAALTSVHYRDVEGVWIAYESTDYELDGRQLFRLRGFAWPRGRRNIRVIYTAGYTEGAEPADVKQAVLDLIALKYRGRGSEALQSQKIGDYSYTRADISRVPGLNETLAHWRRAWTG